MSNELTTPTPSESTAAPLGTEAAAAAASPSTAEAASAAVDRPTYIPETFWDAESKAVKAEDFAKHLDILAATQAEVEARKAAVPESPDKYALALPEGIELPEGMGLDENDPRLPLAREFAHEAGLSQEQFSKMVALDLKREMASAEMVETLKQKEVAKLGDNSTVRIDATTKFIEANAKTPEQAAAVKNMLISADSIEFFENIVTKLSSQGIDPLNGNGNERQVGISEEQWGAMTPSQRLASTWKPAERRS